MQASGLSRRGFLAAASVASAAEPPKKKPNILFLLPDQLRAQALGCMGNTDVRTTNIDRLAGESLLLRNTFANTPVCCPARADMLTGAYAHRNGMIANDLRLREAQPGLAKSLAGAGYRTGFIGKWHLDGGPRMPGFIPPGPRRHGFEFWAANECSHAHFNTQYFRDTPDPIPIRKFEVEAWTDIGVDFLKDSKKDGRPFFLTIQMGPPHDPYRAPAEYTRRYDPEKLKMRPNWSTGPRVPGPKEIAEYYGMVTAIDDQVGRILHELNTLGMRDDTIVLFASDHGDMLGSHGQRLKRKPWEESIHVPGILRYPRLMKKGAATDCPFTHVDIAPTLLSLCGVPVPKEMQGADLSGLVTGAPMKEPDSAFFQIFGPFDGDGTPAGWRGVRTRRHMYARYEKEPWVLYDIDADPYQMRNLANEPSARALREEMDRKLNAWMARTGDSWRYNWTEKVEDGGRLYKQRPFHTVDEFLRWVKQNP